MVPGSRSLRLVLAGALIALAVRGQQAGSYDLVLRGGTLIDGTKQPPVAGDVAIRDGRIAAVGTFEIAPGTAILQVDGLCVSPGFVDVHTHVDAEIARDPLCSNFLRMGVTTIVTGNCGGSVKDLGAHFGRLERGGIGVNYGSLVGHGTVRSAVLDTANRAPTAHELQRMADLVDAAMREGALGLSTGLIYVPGTFADRAEITSLARVVARHGGIYATHMRSENDRVLDAIAEALAIGADAGVPVQISHVKCTGKRNHGRAGEVLAALNAARERGQRVHADQYAYDASSTGLDVLFPDDELAAGRENLATQLRTDAAARARVHEALLRKMDQAGFGDFRYARIAGARGNDELNGLLIPEAASKRLGRDDRQAQADLVIDLFIAAAPARVGMIYHAMDEADVERFLREDWIGIASDAGLRVPGPDRPHPRGSGNNPRVLGRYVRERGVLDLPTAIHKMTAVPARAFGLADRGELRVGARADLVVFDAATVGDRATWTEPLAEPTGLRAVFVNGQLAADRGQVTGVRAGSVLRGAQRSGG